MTKPINKKAQVAEFTRENQAFWGVAGSAFMILHLLVFLIKLDILGSGARAELKTEYARKNINF